MIELDWKEVTNQKEGSYKWQIGKYLKGFTALRKDYDLRKKGIINDYFALDFSELYVYLNNYPTRIDFNLINYIFSNSYKCGYKFTLLPPAILELRKYYNQISLINKKYILPDGSEERRKFSDLSRSFRDYRQNKNESEKKNKWKEVVQKFSAVGSRYDLYFISNISIDYESKSPIDESHKRLMDLFDKKIIIPPNDINFLQDKLKYVTYDQTKYDKVLDYLMTNRPTKEISNIIDAEQAAIVYHINQNYCRNSFLDIFTGSKYPYNIYEKELVITARHVKPLLRQYLVRCPIYLTLRTFCNVELKDDYFDTQDFLEGGQEFFYDLYTFETSQKFNPMPNKMLDREELDAIMKIIKKIKSSLFFMNDPLNYYMDNSFKYSLFYLEEIESFRERFHQEETTDSDKLNILNIMDKISEKDVKELEQDFEESKSRMIENG